MSLINLKCSNKALKGPLNEKLDYYTLDRGASAFWQMCINQVTSVSQGDIQSTWRRHLDVTEYARLWGFPETLWGSSRESGGCWKQSLGNGQHLYISFQCQTFHCSAQSKGFVQLYIILCARFLSMRFLLTERKNSNTVWINSGTAEGWDLAWLLVSCMLLLCRLL